MTAKEIQELINSVFGSIQNEEQEPKPEEVKQDIESIKNDAYEHGYYAGLNENPSSEKLKKEFRENYDVGYKEGFLAGRMPYPMEKAVDYMGKALDAEEAYQRGFVDGQNSKPDAECSDDKLLDEYHEGACDAWAVAKKIFSENGLNALAMIEAFGTSNFTKICEMSFDEVADRLLNYFGRMENE